MANDKTNEASANVRDFTDKAARQVEDNVSRFQSTAKDAASSLQASMHEGAQGYRELGLRAVDIGRSNANAHFDFLKSLFAARSLDQALQIQTSYLRDQSGVVANQMQELSALTQQAIADSARPLQGLAEPTRRARS